MSWRSKRQWIVFLVFFGAVIGVGVLAGFRYWPRASCMDNKKNQDETGVDCGGRCIPCELKNPKQISQFWAHAVQINPNSFDAAALVQNANDALSSANFEYEFTLFDDQGVIAQRSGHTFLYSQERVIIVEPNMHVSRPPTGVSFTPRDPHWELRREIAPDLFIERRAYRVTEENGRKQSVVEASILNNAPVAFREVETLFVLFDKQENIIGINKIVADNLAPGEHRAIRSLWPNVLVGDIARIEIEPRVNIFDPSVIMKPE